MRPFLLLAGLLITLDFSLGSVLGLETDIWWHLAAGRRMLQEGWFTTDPFSFTFADQPWIRVDWLFQVLVWLAYDWGGMNALLWGRALLFCGSWLLLWRVTLINSVHPLAGWIVSLVICHIGAQSVPLRPFAMTFFFTCALLLLLEEARLSRPRALWSVPPLLVVWYNVHIAAVGGILMVVLYAAGQMLARRRPLRRWIAVTIGSGVAAFCTPQPLALAIHPVYFTLFQSMWNSLVAELQFPSWNWPGTLETRLLAAGSLLASLDLARRKQWQLALLAPVCSLLLLTHYRHQFQFSPALLPALCQYARRPLPRQASALMLGIVSFLLLRALFSIGAHKLPADRLVRRETFPESVAQGLQQSPLSLRLFTDMDFAGYYIFMFDGRHKVFIDSRTDQVYAGDGFLKHYLAILAGTDAALPALEKWKVDVAINHRPVTGDSPLFTRRLPASGQWQKLYADNIAEVYVRSGLDLHTRFQAPAYLQAYNRARQAVDPQTDCLQAIQDYPQFSSAHQLLGRLWLRQNRRQLALGALARAQLYNPAAPGLQQDWQEYGGLWSVSWLRQVCLPFLAAL